LWPSARIRSRPIRCPLQLCRPPRVLERLQRRRSHREAQLQTKANAESTKGPTLIPRYPWARSLSSRGNNFSVLCPKTEPSLRPEEGEGGVPSLWPPLFLLPHPDASGVTITTKREQEEGHVVSPSAGDAARTR
jgi:hypothetical protein